MTLPVFEADMFDFGDEPVPEHSNTCVEATYPNVWEFRLIEDSPLRSWNELACWIPNQEMAEQLAAARFRFFRQTMVPGDLWIIKPGGTAYQHYSVGAFFDALGHETERRMAMAVRGDEEE